MCAAGRRACARMCTLRVSHVLVKAHCQDNHGGGEGGQEGERRAHGRRHGADPARRGHGRPRVHPVVCSILYAHSMGGVENSYVMTCVE